MRRMDAVALARWREQTPEDVWNEMKRARQAESDAATHIAALCAVLEEVGEAITAGTLNSDDDGAPETIRRALRRVGRLR